MRVRFASSRRAFSSSSTLPTNCQADEQARLLGLDRDGTDDELLAHPPPAVRRDAGSPAVVADLLRSRVARRRHDGAALATHQQARELEVPGPVRRAARPARSEAVGVLAAEDAADRRPVPDRVLASSGHAALVEQPGRAVEALGLIEGPNHVGHVLAVARAVRPVARQLPRRVTGPPRREGRLP